MKQNKNMKKRVGTWQRNILIALCSVLSVVLIILVFGTVYVHSLLNNLQRVDPDNETMMGVSEFQDMLHGDPDLETVDPNSSETIPHINGIEIDNDDVETIRHGSHVKNILLVGQDRRPGQGRQRSDSMILLTINTSRKTITMTSFMRDQYVEIPGYLPNKLNAPYVSGGFKLLNATLEENFGILIDGNVEVDFTSFAKLVDMLGGVEIELTQAEVDWLRYHNGHDLKAGMNLLTGEQALNYSRIRKLDSDYKRSQRQQKVLTSLFEAYKNKPVTELFSILDDILGMVKTDMSNAEILSLAGDILPMLSSMETNNLRIPVDGTFSAGTVQVRDGLAGWFEYNIDFKANQKILAHLYEK